MRIPSQTILVRTNRTRPGKEEIVETAAAGLRESETMFEARIFPVVTMTNPTGTASMTMTIPATELGTADRTGLRIGGSPILIMIMAMVAAILDR